MTEYNDERIRIPGVGSGRDMGTQLDYDLSRPLLTREGQPRSHRIVVGAEVAGSRDSEAAFTGDPLSGSWAPARVSPVAVSGTVMHGAGVLRGYSMRETSGTADAVIRVRAGINAQAPIMATVHLASDESVTQYFGESGLRTDNGVYFEIVSGVVEGSVYVQGTL